MNFSLYKAPPHNSIQCPLLSQSKQIHVLLHTLSPSLQASAPALNPHHLQTSTGWHPIIFTLNTPHVQNISICDAWQHQPNTGFPKDCTNLYCTFRHQSDTFISPSYVTLCGQGQENLGKVCERWHEFAWVAAWMGNIQGYVEGFHS